MRSLACIINGRPKAGCHFPRPPNSGPPGVVTALKYLAAAGLASVPMRPTGPNRSLHRGRIENQNLKCTDHVPAPAFCRGHCRSQATRRGSGSLRHLRHRIVVVVLKLIGLADGGTAIGQPARKVITVRHRHPTWQPHPVESVLGVVKVGHEFPSLNRIVFTLSSAS